MTTRHRAILFKSRNYTQFGFIIIRIVLLPGIWQSCAGVKNLKVLDPSTTLGDLGMDSMIVIEIQQLLERKYNVVLNAKDTRSLTVERVLEINGSSD